MRKRLAAAAAAVLLPLWSCTSAERSVSGGANGGTMIVDWTLDAGDLFPPFAGTDVDQFVDDQVFDRLADISQDLNTIGDKTFTPHLAKSWTWAPDSLSIAFSIDPRARWHDGQPVLANDVRFTYQVYSNPKVASPTASQITDIDSVSVRDSLTAVFWFKRHIPEQFYQAVGLMQILPAHVYSAMPVDQMRTSDKARHPVGSGRFRFVSWEPGARLELVADTANYFGRPRLDRVIVTPVDPPTAATQILAGQADFFGGIPWEQSAKLDSSSVARGVPLAAQTAYTFMAMNLQDQKVKARPHPIFGDLAVRRAISMAVDRAAMLQNVFGKFGEIGLGPFPRGLPTSDSTLRLPPFDTVAAKAMLETAGWRAREQGGPRMKDGKELRFSLLAPTSSTLRTRYAVLIQGQLQRVGVQVDIEPLDQNAAVAKQQKGDFDAALISFHVDPSVTAAKDNWGTSGIGPTGQNVARYSNRRVDALIDSAAKAFDLGRARSYTSRAYQQIIDDAPAIWLYDVVTLAGINRRIDPAPFRVDAWWARLSDWSIPADKRIDRDRIGLGSTPR